MNMLMALNYPIFLYTEIWQRSLRKVSLSSEQLFRGSIFESQTSSLKDLIKFLILLSGRFRL